jgi:endonuclease YncB( thermonuclease family)
MRARLPAALTCVVAAAVTSAALSQQRPRALVGATFTAHVVAVADGDTLDVRRTGTNTRLRIRLDGVDAPEAGEPFSTVARTRTRVLAFDKTVRIAGRDVDRYDRLVARVIVPDKDGDIDVSVALVREGIACYFDVFRADPVLARAEADARAAGRGFWARDAPMPACATRNAAAPRAAVAAPGVAFIGNRNSRVFHALTCRNANCPNCTVKFASREEATAAGFRPAGDCLR